ncbi:hypothetical protein KY290_025094 [Solanum tuberosum]|uniref:SWIM-type domain-containing protein n=1 Tax=Solanum tuberosum TaxID=4113 RepID=A0ABQ7UUD8_SOLTU|nr:hypothetical protein KY284_023941 [Solanum tuberosum]KAH0754824.1 hypothetical protein KY290_025094 [Solanum tuberosum]
MEKEVLRLNTMDLHILWTLLVGVVVVDPGSSGAFLVLMVLLPFITRSCSCRSWQLRGIPCPHGVAALHYKELEPIHYVASCYSNETYLNTYAHFIQPMNNIKIWPTSNNPIVKPPKIKKLPGRPGKARGTGPSQSAEPSFQTEATTNNESGRGRCTGRVSSFIGVPTQSHGTATNTEPELPSRRVINTGTTVTKRADVVSGDIGYTPVCGFKWKGKTTITSSNLERMRAEKVIQTRSAAAATANSQTQTTSSRKTSVPWK